MRDQGGPAGLVGGAEPRCRVAVEVLVEADVVVPARVFCEGRSAGAPDVGPRASGRNIDTSRSRQVRRPPLEAHLLPEPVGYSTVKPRAEEGRSARSASTTSKFTGNQTGPRQFELPPNSADRRLGRLVVDGRPAVDLDADGMRRGASADIDRSPYGDRNRASSNTLTSTRAAVPATPEPAAGGCRLGRRGSADAPAPRACCGRTTRRGPRSPAAGRPGSCRADRQRQSARPRPWTAPGSARSSRRPMHDVDEEPSSSSHIAGGVHGAGDGWEVLGELHRHVLVGPVMRGQHHGHVEQVEAYIAIQPEPSLCSR